MKIPKKSKISNSNYWIYHHELDLEYESNATYFLFTEIEDGIPQRSFYYKIPDAYKGNAFLGEVHEKYAPYCPN
jgi:hypothetical protein